MSFDDIEQSNERGRPVALYEFRLGSIFWRYTSADRDIVATSTPVGGATTAKYASMPIKEDNLTIGGDASQDDYNVTLLSDCEVVKLFKGTPPLDVVWVTIRRMHVDDQAAEAPVHWIGTISSVKRADAVSSTIVCNTLGVTFARGGLRLCWETNCPRMLYDPGCGVDPEERAVSSTITALTGNSISCPDLALQPAGYFDGGYMSWKIDDETFVRRGLVGDTGIQLTAQIDTPSNAAIPHLMSTGAAPKDEGPDWQTVLEGLYSGQIAEMHETDGTNYFFLRRDKDAFVAPADVYADENWKIVYSQDNAVLYRWDNDTPFPDQGSFSGTLTAGSKGDQSTSITLLGTTDGLTVGTRVRLYPGCDRTTGANGCTKFNNLPNFGGIPQLAGRSPFDGNPVF